MYRRSDHSESTAGGHTEFTRQSGKLPGEGIISDNKQNAITGDNTVIDDRKFDTLDIPACVRGGEHSRVRGKSSAQPSAAGKSFSLSSEQFCNGTTKRARNGGENKQTGSSVPLRGQSEIVSGHSIVSNSHNIRASVKETKNGSTLRLTKERDPKKRSELKGKAAFGNTSAIGNTAAFTGVSARGEKCILPNATVKERGQNRVSMAKGGPAVPLYKKKKRREPILVAAAELLRRRSVVMGLALCLLLVIIIPIAAFAASSGNLGNNSPDIEINEKMPSSEDVFLSESVSIDDLNVGSVVQKDEKKSDEVPEAEAEIPDAEAGEIINDDAIETAVMTEDTPDEVDVYTVTFMFYDREPLTCMSEPATLRDILAGSGYFLTESDKVYVDVDTVINSDQTVYIDKVEYGTVTETEYIPYDVETVEVQTIPRGTSQVITEGVSGTKEVVYNVEYINGVEASRTESYSYITEYPQNQVEQYGVGGIVYGDDGSAHSFSYCIPVNATYYNLDGNTATGMPVQDGVVAVDPSVFPLGTHIYLKNDYMDMGVRVCADTGVYGNIVDVWMNENSQYYAAFASHGVFNFMAYVLD